MLNILTKSSLGLMVIRERQKSREPSQEVLCLHIYGNTPTSPQYKEFYLYSHLESSLRP